MTFIHPCSFYEDYIQSAMNLHGLKTNNIYGKKTKFYYANFITAD